MLVFFFFYLFLFLYYILYILYLYLYYIFFYVAFLLLVWYDILYYSLFVVYSPFYGLIYRHKQYIKIYFVLCQNFLRVFSCIGDPQTYYNGKVCISYICMLIKRTFQYHSGLIFNDLRNLIDGGGGKNAQGIMWCKRSKSQKEKISERAEKISANTCV